MHRWSVVAWVICAGCAPQPRVETPAPVAETAVASKAPDSSRIELLPPAPRLDLARAVGDTALLRALSRDSLLDAEMLEKLHEVTGVATGSPANTLAEVDLAEMFDINVARYADHARVRFYLDFFQGPARERMAVWLERLPHYEPIVRRVFQSQGLPSDLVYLGLIESGYSNTAVSRSKAVGMWQFMRGTAKGFGLTVDRWVDERRDFLKATNAAARYLSELTKQFNGSHYLAAAAYNSGAGTVTRGLLHLPTGGESEDEDSEASDSAGPVEDDLFFQLSGTRYLRKETKDYVPKLIAAAMIAKQPEKYGFPAIARVEPYAVDSIPVSEATSLEVIARAGQMPESDVLFLNPHLLRGITPPGRMTWVRVPFGKGVATTEALAAVPESERVPAMLHTVGRRESLRSIAKRYRVTEAQVKALNPGLNPGVTLAVGTTVRVPGTVRVQNLVVDDQRQSEARVRRAGSRSTHQVGRGETLASIAERYGVTVAELARWNHLKPTSRVRAGQRLVVSGRSSAAPARSAAKTTKAAPPPRRSTHVVRRGETLTSLARRYGVSVEALKAANGLRTAADLKAGRRLTIPS
jgi:membrane-bound lytic murein transglycosylase D